MERRISKQAMFEKICQMVSEKLESVPHIVSSRRLYYVSAEFLIGNMLASNLINLGLYEKAEEMAKEQGYLLQEILDMEQEPSLGNGGLGRLAACYLDSIAALQLPGDGIGLLYHCGLFRQEFCDGKQKELPDFWLHGNQWLKRTNTHYTVEFSDISLLSTMYTIDMPGYNGKKNTLRLFDLDSCDEALIREGIAFDKTAIDKNLTLFLYPDDSDEDGRLLRIYQQYFMVSNAAQYIIEDCRKQGYDLHRLHEHVCIQINDTHPTMIIPELIRLLMSNGILMREAIDIVRKTCAYTNHTILAEALETWPYEYLKKAVPQLMGIIEALDALTHALCEDRDVQIIDDRRQVHMAHMDIHFSKSINGVAALHTDILKHTELKPFYRLYPYKFNNKTNGISFRRWLYSCNRELTAFLRTYIPEEEFRRDDFHRLLQYVKEDAVLEELLMIKQKKKQQFADDIWEKQQLSVSVDSIFDVQSKRLHEYKRQQMHALYIIFKYLDIKKGNPPKRPITFIFGAKAAPAYTIAKDIIHLLLCLQKLVGEDDEVSPYMRICFIENYNVSKAEKLIPACDISEQISLASKEASGTGNMKFMLNGAVTLGTRDGANAEIEELVGDDAIFIFGKQSEEVIAHYEKNDYCAKKIYEEDTDIRTWMDFIIGDALGSIGDRKSLRRLYDEILYKDWFMTLLDVKEYVECKERMLNAYENRKAWAVMMMKNIAKSGFFSSDRSIREYDRDIWHL
ncbi:MAG: glycogen/starch/alpha-glucan phosphorylase [Erysipelotrichaceae bacterium]|jgi:starch phosphorylase|nr:glycogen/starch/alpha-glucan phosphorylase [Erysipelotrichaceae bacterium]